MSDDPRSKIVIMNRLKECEEMVNKTTIPYDDVPVVCDMIDEVKHYLAFLADLEAC